MKLYGGIDLHSNNSVFHLIDKHGAVILRKRMARAAKRKPSRLILMGDW